MICALLLGREKSLGFPGKNLYPMLGRPMVAYPLMAAGAATTVDSIHVSTDSPQIMEISRQYGAQIIERPAHLATGAALGEHAYQHAFEVVRDQLAARGESIELLVLLFANAATVTAETIDRAVAVLRERPDIDSAVTVSRYNMWSPLRARREDADGLLKPFVPFETFGDPSTLNCDRDSQGDVWFADMSLSVVRPRCLERLEEGMLPQKWMGQNIYPIKQWGGLDVDYEWQMPQVEFWLKAHGFTAPERGGL
jgi:CMP-N-acetylneuraminic acid synthetase